MYVKIIQIILLILFSDDPRKPLYANVLFLMIFLLQLSITADINHT